jgi:hypothetical protein
MWKPIACCLLAAAAVLAADAPASVARKVLDGDLTMVERELVPLAEAMPSDKYDFAPSQGAFESVRTFGQQVSHVAAVIYACSAAVLGEKNPVDMGKNENGPASLRGKSDIVRFLKDSIAYGHKALATVTDANVNDMVQSAFEDNRVARLYMANVLAWHSMDHYGQMVVYARMNGIVPPASRR